ncbi:MAG: DUF3078 domain-containing protein [Chitinivibrionales bacterium]|nr:DUF3078 domain-containing protein [Chitinivibrionales bacterium]
MRFLTKTVALAVCVVAFATAQDNTWRIDIDWNLTSTLNAYNDAWEGGEVGTFTWTTQLNASAQKQLAKMILNKNVLKLAFGQSASEGDSTGWSAPKKTTDLIDFESVFQFTLGILIDPFVSVRVVSQFYDVGLNSDYPVVNPVDLTESFGVARDIVKDETTSWNARIGGAVHQYINRMGVNPEGDKVLNDAGLEFVTDFKTTLREGWIEFNSNFKLYQALLPWEDEERDVVEDGQLVYPYLYPDITWQNILTVNITKYIMLSLTDEIRYDREKNKGGQNKFTTALGITYKFSNRKKKGKE